MSEHLGLKEVITITSPIIKSIVDTFIIPKIESLKNRLSLDFNKYIIPTENHFREYFFRSYKKFSTVNTLVFSNSQRFLKDIYVPLTLDLVSDYKIKYKIEGFPHGLIHTYNKVLITDTAGMGKSTLLKRIFLDVIDHAHGIPVVVELRRLSKDKRLIQELHEQLNSINKDFDENLLLELLNQGDFVIFLDGFDEIALSEREFVTSDIQNFISKAGSNKFILTSRPESALTSFGDFQQFKIEPLKRREAFELLRKYDKQGEVSRLLIKKLEESEYNNIGEFLTNPLLVSLLFTAFEHKQVIPFKKHIFYRQVYDANFESHDLTKGDSFMREKLCGLDIDDFHRVLRNIGFSCLKGHRIEFTKDEILSLITKAKEFCSGIDFKESDFLKDLTTSVPLFTQDGNYYRWSHKSLQEYFAAQFIYLDSKGHQKDILERLYRSNDVERYSNTFDLYYDIDYKGFRSIIIYQMLKEFSEYCQNSFTSIENVSKELIIERKELTFWTNPFLFKAIEKNDKKNDTSFDHMILEIEKDESFNPNSMWGFMYGTKSTNYIAVIDYENPKILLLSILLKRKNRIVKYYEPILDRVSYFKAPLKYMHKDEYKSVKLTDSKELRENTSIYFHEINQLLLFYRFVPFTFDYEEAIKEYVEIENENRNESAKDFFFNDL